MPSLRSFRSDQNGAVAATYAIAVTGLIIIAGAAFDYNRIMALDSELQTAADKSALAGVTQLDGRDGACARGGNAAIAMLRNVTLLSNDALGNTVTVDGGTTASVSNDQCAAFSNITFYSDSAGTVATTDEDAAFIKVGVDVRAARYSFTPVGALIGSNARAFALAGLSSAVCDVPPLMVCNPNPGATLSTNVGWGVQVTGHGNTRDGPGGTVGAWAPGDFGFLEVGAGQLSDLVAALAFDQQRFNCAPVDGTVPETGNAQGLYDAINTRFDIFDFSTGNGTTLAPCFSGSCPAASNAVKDMVKTNTATNGNACKISAGMGGNGWRLPPAAEQFWPLPSGSIANPGSTAVAHNDTSHTPTITAMGHPRDLCHYSSYNLACGNDPNNRFGNGAWARSDYFNLNHGGVFPPGAATITRYQTYLWELGVGPYAGGTGTIPNNATTGQRGTPICTPAYSGTPDLARRVLTIAVVDNCAALSGASTPVDIGEWVEVFLVEPVIDGRGNGSLRDSIYMEIIGPANVGDGNGGVPPSGRRDKPYLVE